MLVTTTRTRDVDVDEGSSRCDEKLPCVATNERTTPRRRRYSLKLRHHRGTPFAEWWDSATASAAADGRSSRGGRSFLNATAEAVDGYLRWRRRTLGATHAARDAAARDAAASGGGVFLPAAFGPFPGAWSARGNFFLTACHKVRSGALFGSVLF